MTATLFKFLAMFLVLKISLPETSFNGLPIEICLGMVFYDFLPSHIKSGVTTNLGGRLD